MTRPPLNGCLFLLIVGLGLFAFARWRIWKISSGEILKTTINTLKPDEQGKTVITPSKVISVKKTDGGKIVSSITYKPPEAVTTITTGKDGTVTVSTTKMGFCFAPGVGLGYERGPTAVLDAKIAYMSRFGIVVGGAVNETSGFFPYAGLSYQVYGNTSLFTGVGPKKALIGIRLSF